MGWNRVLAPQLSRAINTPSACDEWSEERRVGLGPWLRKEIIQKSFRSIARGASGGATTRSARSDSFGGRIRSYAPSKTLHTLTLGRRLIGNGIALDATRQPRRHDGFRLPDLGRGPRRDVDFVCVVSPVATDRCRCDAACLARSLRPFPRERRDRRPFLARHWSRRHSNRVDARSRLLG